MPKIRTYYEILEIENDADRATIRRAYRRAVIAHHPDRENQSERSQKRIRELNIARETLLNDKRRAKYDKQLREMGIISDEPVEDAEPVRESVFEESDFRSSSIPPENQWQEQGHQTDTGFSESFDGYSSVNEPEPYDTSQNSGNRYHFDKPKLHSNYLKRRRKKSLANFLILFFTIPMGGISGVAVAIMILWVGFQMDPFNLFTKTEVSFSGVAIETVDSDSNADGQTVKETNGKPPTTEARPILKPEPEPEPEPETEPEPEPEPETETEPETSRTQPQPNLDPLTIQPPSQLEPLPIPSNENLAIAQKKFDEVYAERVIALEKHLKSKHKTVGDRNEVLIAFAEELYELQAEEKDTVIRYVLLDAATRWAIMSGDIDLTYEYILDFSQSYEIDSLQYKFDAINVWDREIDRTLNGEDQKSAKIDLSGIALILADDADELERFPMAFELLKLVVKMPIDKQLSGKLKRRIVELKSALDRQELMEEISEEIKVNPDPAKALLLGQYLCFEKNDWSNGLPFLSVCSDATLAEAAQSEIAGVEDNYAIGNAWWETSLNLAEPFREIALSRALGFYELGFQVTPDELTSQLNETKIFELGKYFLFEKNDLPNAFSVLAQCSNAEFKQVAELELTPEKTLEQTIELGDAWFSIAQSLEPDRQNTAYRRAVLYYKGAVDKTQGLEKARLQKRLIDSQNQIEDSSGDTSAGKVSNQGFLKGGGKVEEPDGIAEKDGMTTFFGAKQTARNVVFVIDNSTSMTKGKFETALNELSKAVGNLNPQQKFHVIFYSDMAYMMFHPKPVTKLLPATEANIESLRQWLQTVEMCMKTNGAEAMKAALMLKPDVICVLGDGAFTDNTKDLLTAPHSREIVINTYGMQVSGNGRDQLKSIARANSGKYRDVAAEAEAAKLARQNPIRRNRSRGKVWGITLPVIVKK